MPKLKDDSSNPIPKLSDLIIGRNADIGGAAGDIYISESNIDDIFTLVKKWGWNEVLVSEDVMRMVIQYYLVYMERKLDAGKETLKILRDGKVDKFLGVKIRLEKDA